MKELAYIVLLITASNIEEANKIAELLLNQRKAACVNIVPGLVHSSGGKTSLIQLRKSF